MDETRIANRVTLRGAVNGGPVFSHESRGENFYQFSMDINRLSGTTDCINVISREQLLRDLEVGENKKLCVVGELRSFNNRIGKGNRLVITVFARELSFEGGEDTNLVELEGVICKPPNLRTTPMGREICDLMVAVNRRYGRSDYLPCISWGKLAKDASLWPVGTRIILSGRAQSRRYIKNFDDFSIEKTAYEVSVISMKKC